MIHLLSDDREVEIALIDQWIRLRDVVSSKDIEERGLTKNTKGLVITKIANDSPINYLEEGNIIIEAQKKVIKTIKDLEITGTGKNDLDFDSTVYADGTPRQ